ncbi:MAG: alpha/beta hydrolase [Caldilineaceae bacterium]|nr:alpha/beta hydrolase [Caldilineaceae bacterium]
MALVDKSEGMAPAVQQRGRGVLRWIVRVVLGVILLLLLLVITGAGYQWFASAADRRAYPPPGELVDVGGHRLHIVCLGEGSPTVILDALGDGTSAQWGWVQPVVAQVTRVCAYDRAGRGWSEVGPPPRDTRTIAEELHTLLINAGIEGPTVLVGHSFGAMVGRVYTDLYPEKVAGLVWIDPGLPGLRSERMPPEAHAQADADMKLMNVAPLMARLGIFRLIGIDPSLPEPQNSYAQAFYASNAFWDSLRADAQTLSLSDAEVETTGSLGDRPLMIVSATNGWVDPNGPADESRRIFNAMQEELLPLSTNSRQVLVEGASHASLVMEQAHAAQTADAIVQVVEAVRNGTRLSP